MKALFLALFLALALAAPPSAAHAETFSQAKGLQAGPFLVFFDLRPSPPFAQQTTSIVAQIADAGTGAPIKSAPATVLVAGPGDFSQRKAMEPDGTGYHVASMLIPQRGNYSARIFVVDESTNETHATDTEFEVFPDIPYRIRGVDQGADPIVGQRTPIAFEVVDPVTLQPKTISDIKVRLEHWSDDHTLYLGAQDEPAERVGTGAWRITPTFADKGMYHIRFASDAGGFNYDDVPLLHIYATSPPPAEDNESPSGGAVGAVLALLGVALLLRRR